MTHLKAQRILKRLLTSAQADVVIAETRDLLAALYAAA
jgi:hypothetical protein